MVGTRTVRVAALRSIGRYVPPIALAIATFAALCLLSLSPRSGSPITAIFPPWFGLADIMRALETTDARLIRTGALEQIVILEQAASDMPARLREAGAWLVLDGNALSACMPAFGRSSDDP